MKINCDRVLTIDDFDESYSSWKGRVLTIMGEYIKVSQDGIQSQYFDTVYLFEKSGILIGFRYGTPLNECYLTTIDGQVSECYVDAMPSQHRVRGGHPAGTGVCAGVPAHRHPAAGLHRAGGAPEHRCRADSPFCRQPGCAGTERLSGCGLHP